MKSIIIFSICCIALLRANAADEPLIPAAMNSVLLKIQPGMTTNQIVAILSPSYPKVSSRMGLWSGQTGYVDYIDDGRLMLSVSSLMRDGKMLVHDNLLFMVYDFQTKRRVEIKLCYWDENKQTNKK